MFRETVKENLVGQRNYILQESARVQGGINGKITHNVWLHQFC